MGRAICFTPTDSDANLIQKHPHRHAQNNGSPNTWASYGPVKLTQKLIYTHWFSSYLILWLTPLFYCILSKANFVWPLSPWGLSRRLSGKKSAYQAGDTGSISGSGRSPGGGNGNPLQYSCLENPIDREAWWAILHWGSKESDTTERLHFTLCDFSLFDTP